MIPSLPDRPYTPESLRVFAERYAAATGRVFAVTGPDGKTMDIDGLIGEVFTKAGEPVAAYADLDVFQA